VLHHVERCAGDVRVVARGERSWNARPGAGEAGEDAVLAIHVVRGREDLTEWRAAEDDRAPGGVFDAEGEVRLALAHADEAERRLELRQAV
jgi:hypothetical protein